MTENTLFSVIGVDTRALGPIYERSEYPAGSGLWEGVWMTESTLPSVIGVDLRALGPIYE